MINLTITLDENTLKKARIRALEENTSVNQIVREYLEAFAGVRSEQSRSVEKVLALSKSSSSRRGNRRWTRDELHERR